MRRRSLLGGGVGLAGLGSFAGCVSLSGTQDDGSGEETDDEFPTRELTREVEPAPYFSRTFQYDDGRTGTSPESTGPADGAETYWRYRTGEPPDVDLMPALYGLTLVVPGSRGLRAFDVRTGERRWHRERTAPLSAPTIAADRVLVGGSGLPGERGMTGLYAFELESGEERWHADPRRMFTAPVERDGVVYASHTAPLEEALDGDVGAVAAFDLGVGTEQWEYRVGAQPGAAALADGAVVVTAESTGEVHAIDAATGDGLWVESVGAHGTPTVRDGEVYVGTDDRIVALDAGDGSERWAAPVPGAVRESVVATETTVYAALGDEDGFVAVDRNDGSIDWERSASGDWRAPVVVDGHLYAGGSGEVRCLDAADGGHVWTFETARRQEADVTYSGKASTPLVLGGTVFVATDAGDVYALGEPVE